MQFLQQKKQANQRAKSNFEDGCQIKVSRDKEGRIKSVNTNGKCSKSEIEVFRENLHSIESSDSE